MASDDVAARIEALLRGAEVAYRVLEHPAADTAVDVARVRGTPLAIGGKSLVMKLDRGIGFAVLVVGGDRRIDNRLLRRHLGLRRYRFATRDELAELTGLVPGCVPPFGRPLFDLPLYVDAERLSHDRIAFSLASHTRSAEMAVSDWLSVAKPTDVFGFV